MGALMQACAWVWRGAQGVVLRDVKPENFLFLSRDAGAPLKMIDFGISEYCTSGQVLEERAGAWVGVVPGGGGVCVCVFWAGG